MQIIPTQSRQQLCKGELQQGRREQHGAVQLGVNENHGESIFLGYNQEKKKKIIKIKATAKIS